MQSIRAALPNGSRLSCGASAGGRKRPALRYELARAQTFVPLRAGPASFKRLLGSADLDDPNEYPRAVVTANRMEELTCHSEPGAVDRAELRPQ